MSNKGIYNITVDEKHSFVREFKRKDKATEVYIPFTGVWKMVISRDEKGVIPLKTYTVGNGLEISDDTLTLYVDVTVILNDLKSLEDDHYYYDIRRDAGGYSEKFLKGDFNVNMSITPP